MANPSSTISTPVAAPDGPMPNGIGLGSNGIPAPSPPSALKWPTIEDVREDWAWAHEVEEHGGFGDEYTHKHVAIFNKTVVGSGADYTQLRHEMANKFGVHPERIIMIYIDSNFVDVAGDD